LINVLITGANRGLGLGFVKKYLEKNVHVLCTTRDISGSKELLECKERYPNNIEIFELDLLKENGAETLANQLNGTPIDILINRSMKERKRHISETEKLQKQVDFEYSMPEADRDTAKLANLETQLSFARNSIASYTNEYTKLLSEQQKISKDLKATREQ